MPCALLLEVSVLRQRQDEAVCRCECIAGRILRTYLFSYAIVFGKVSSSVRKSGKRKLPSFHRLRDCVPLTANKKHPAKLWAFSFCEGMIAERGKSPPNRGVYWRKTPSEDSGVSFGRHLPAATAATPPQTS